LKTPVGSNLRGEMGHTLIPDEKIKAMDIRDKYRKGEMSREDAQNKLAAMYKSYHEEYD
jgi:N-formylglutamate amidohydrolase